MQAVDKEIGFYASNQGLRQAGLSLRAGMAWIAVLLLYLAAIGTAEAQPVPYQGGDVMQTVRAHLIFWLPTKPTKKYDVLAATTAANPGGNSTYISTIQNFFSNLGAETEYYETIAQYGLCPAPNDCGLLPAQPLQNPAISFDPIKDTYYVYDTFPHFPVTDTDIQNEIHTLRMTHSTLKGGLSDEYFVFFGQDVIICQGAGPCTSLDFCAYHSSFVDNTDEQSVVYAVMPQVQSHGTGCGLIIDTKKELANLDSWPVNYTPSEGDTPNEVNADWEIVVLSHELFESITDPFGKAWNDESRYGEIGDRCNRMVGGVISDGSNVMLNRHPYLVQELWSNAHDACVLGWTMELQVDTGNPPDPGLSSNSAAAGTLYKPDGTPVPPSVLLKAHGDDPWHAPSVNFRVFRFVPGNQLGITHLDITLLAEDSNSTPNDWGIDFVAARVLDPDGYPICHASSNTPQTLSTTTPGLRNIYRLDIPNCPPKPVVSGTPWGPRDICAAEGGFWCLRQQRCVDKVTARSLECLFPPREPPQPSP